MIENQRNIFRFQRNRSYDVQQRIKEDNSKGDDLSLGI